MLPCSHDAHYIREMKTGLVSVSFRSLPSEEIIRLAADNELDGIEWGGDIHVPPGDVALAQRVGNATRSAGLQVACYGSYLRLAETDADEAHLDSAEALGSPWIRVWAGNRSSVDADASYRARVVEHALRLADAAHARSLRIAYEYHGKTLTDSLQSAAWLLKETRHPAICTLWQPINGASESACIESLKEVLPRLANLHVFHWEMDADGRLVRLPLAHGADRWRKYLALAGERPEFALLEFLAGDSREQLRDDAQTLRGLIAGQKADSGS